MEFIETYNAIQRRFPHSSRVAKDHISTISIPLYGDCDAGEEVDLYCLCLSTLFAKYTIVTVTTTRSSAVTTLILAAMGNKTVLTDGATDMDQQIVRIDGNIEYGVVFNNNGIHMITPLNGNAIPMKSGYKIFVFTPAEHSVLVGVNQPNCLDENKTKLKTFFCIPKGHHMATNGQIFDAVVSPKTTICNFSRLLRTASKDIRNHENLNVLESILKHGRFLLLPVLVQLDWWTHLRAQETVWINKADYSTQHECKRMDAWEKSLSPLLRACRAGNIPRFDSIVGQDVYTISHIDNVCGNALYWAVVSGNKELLQRVLDKGVYKTLETLAKESPLHVACDLGHSHLIQKLAYCNPYDRTINGYIN
jgi:hypothetical protein